MYFRNNSQFLQASKKYYKSCSSKEQCDCPENCNSKKPSNQCDCTANCNRESCCGPCDQSCECDVCPQRNTPKTITDVLCSLINEQVDITTPFGTITGTLLDVKCDYIVLLEDTGSQVLVRTDKIESVSPMT